MRLEQITLVRFRPLGLISITTQLWSEYDKQTWG